MARGILAGLFATTGLSVLMLIERMIGLVPAIDVIAMLGSMPQHMMGMGGEAVGWALHFMIGAVIFGALFARLNDTLPGNSQIKKGVVFSVIAWLVMMVGDHADGRCRHVRYCDGRDGTCHDVDAAYDLWSDARIQLRHFSAVPRRSGLKGMIKDFRS